MPRGQLSKEGRARIAAAQRARWAKYRKEGGGPATGGAPKSKKKRARRGGARGKKRGAAKRMGRPPMAGARRLGRPAGSGGRRNPFLAMNIEELVHAKGQLEQALRAAQSLLK